MMQKITQRFTEAAAGIVSAFALLALGDAAWSWYDRKIPAIEWTGVEVLTPKVEPGQLMRAVFKAIIRKQCPGETTRVLIYDEDGRILVRYPVMTSGFQKSTDGLAMAYPFSIRIPLTTDEGEQFKRGAYTLRTSAVRFCETGIDVDNDTPEIRFAIVG